MIVLPDTKTFDSSIRLVQLVGGVTKVNMLKATPHDGGNEKDYGGIILIHGR